MPNLRISVLVLFSLLLSVPAFAETVTYPAAGPVPYLDCDYRTAVCLEDDFASGGTTAGTVGRLGWFFGGSGTTVAYQPGEANEAGIARRNTTAVSGIVSYIIPQGLQDAFVAGSLDVLFRARLNQVDANTTFRIGAGYIVNATITNGQYFERLDADTNIFCVTRAASVQTGSRTDSGVAANTSPHVFFVKRTASTLVQFFIDGVEVCRNTTNIPSQALTPFAQITNSTTADKTMDLMYFKLRYPVSR